MKLFQIACESLWKSIYLSLLTGLSWSGLKWLQILSEEHKIGIHPEFDAEHHACTHLASLIYLLLFFWGGGLGENRRTKRKPMQTWGEKWGEYVTLQTDSNPSQGANWEPPSKSCHINLLSELLGLCFGDILHLDI